MEFDKQYKKKFQELIAQGKTEDEAKKLAPSILEAQKCFRLGKWKTVVIELWKTMNQWVYDGFAQTYKILALILIAIIMNRTPIYLERSSAIWFRKRHFRERSDGFGLD